MNKIFMLFIFLVTSNACNTNRQSDRAFSKISGIEPGDYPTLTTEFSGEDTIAAVFHIAIGDIETNIRIRQGDAIDQKALLFAGYNYSGAWTRDAAINVWNGAGLLIPEISKNTLYEVLTTNVSGDTIISGQYWDKIIWTIGAWNFYLFTGDKKFLNTAYKASINTIAELERNEYDNTVGLFRGAAVYGDGIAAYDDMYTQTGEYKKGGIWLSNIDKWALSNPGKIAKPGFGLPMFCLSTNCIYYETYGILNKMEKELGLPPASQWLQKALSVKKSINKHLWDNINKRYYYYIDPWKKMNAQEGLGIAFVCLFGIADSVKASETFKGSYTSPNGIPCVYPVFSRYSTSNDKKHYGRHSGTVWPFIQGFWAQACIKQSQPDKFMHEWHALNRNVFRDVEFRELYHPITGQPYGGLQEDGFVKGKIRLWESTHRQTWNATTYIRMLLFGLLGMEIDEKGCTFRPDFPVGYENFHIRNIRYRNSLLSIKVNGKGNKINEFKVNDQIKSSFIPENIQGEQYIEITLE